MRNSWNLLSKSISKYSSCGWNFFRLTELSATDAVPEGGPPPNELSFLEFVWFNGDAKLLIYLDNPSFKDY